ncbi:hypothetical protein WAI453_012850 [Rhynchosporium graminicola]
MFGKSKAGRSSSNNRTRERLTWDVPVFFGLMFLLSIAELFFSVDSFQYLQRKHKWHSKTERSRLAFLIFSSARTILLSAVYCGFHCARKHFHSMLHTAFLVISTILWIVSGVLIHQMWGLIKCNEGLGGVKELRDGLSECHELKIIEIIAWVLAGVSVLATVPVVMNAMKRRKRQAARKTETSG